MPHEIKNFRIPKFEYLKNEKRFRSKTEINFSSFKSALYYNLPFLRQWLLCSITTLIWLHIHIFPSHFDDHYCVFHLNIYDPVTMAYLLLHLVYNNVIFCNIGSPRFFKQIWRSLLASFKPVFLQNCSLQGACFSLRYLLLLFTGKTEYQP